MSKTKTILLIFALIAMKSFAQEPSKWFCAFNGELPSYHLSGQNVLSQQTTVGLGYQINNKASLFVLSGLGIKGFSPTNLPATIRNYSIVGIGGDLLFPLNNSYSIGIEIGANFGVTEGTILNPNFYNFGSYQAGIKLKQNNVSATLGARTYKFDAPENNTTELFFSIGFRLPGQNAK